MMSDDDPAGSNEHELSLVQRWRRPASQLTPNEMTRRWIIRTAMAVVISLALFAGLVFLTTSSDDDDASVIGAARLVWNPDRDDPLGEGKAASAEVIDDDGEQRLFVFDIEVLRPPADAEFIEAWLVDRRENGDMFVSVGRFDTIRTRLFTLPDDVDPLGFEAVLFSLELDDGDPGYSGRSLIQGDLVWITEPPS